MTGQAPATGLQLRSRVTPGGTVELSLIEVPVAASQPDEVVVRVEAAPLNPSDLGLLLAGADVGSARRTKGAGGPVLTMDLPPGSVERLAGRLDQSMPVGNEGAGTVVAAGSSEDASALLGKTVAFLGGASYAQYRTLRAADCLVLPEGAKARDGASAFVNPMTALAMIETMRHEGHTALVHTAAASNLGQMLVKLCLRDGIGLVNIVRSAAQRDLLRSLGAVHVCDTSSPGFEADLVEALVATKATIAFDAIGGGTLAGRILVGMEAAVNRYRPSSYARYGSTIHKQVYLYGSLDPSPTVIDRSIGMAWGVGGWLVLAFLQTLDPAVTARLRARIAAELTTTFASRYAAEISLAEALDPEVVAAYAKRATGQKYLVRPDKGLSADG